MIEGTSMTAQKILYVAPWPPQKNGIADYAWNFKQNLEQTGFAVDTLATDEKRWDKLSLPGLAREIKILRALIHSGNYSVIHVESGGSLVREFIFAYYTARWVKETDIKLVITVHDAPTLIDKKYFMAWTVSVILNMSMDKMKKRIMRFFWLSSLISHPAQNLFTRLHDHMHKKIYANCHMVFALTAKGQASIAAMYNLSTKARVLPHTILLNRQPVKRTDLFAKSEGKIIIAVIGFIADSKGIDTLLEAVALLTRKKPELKDKFTVWICGDIASATAARYRDLLLGFIKDDHARSGVHIEFKGFIPEEAMDHLLSLIDIMVVPAKPTTIYPTSGSIIRGMTAGKALVVSDVRGYSSEISDNVTGLLFQGSAKQLADKLLLLLTKPDLRISLGKNARRHILDEHSAERIGNIVGEVYAGETSTVC
jgi:glycosyltransferase involved in cell wall biosynthesis